MNNFDEWNSLKKEINKSVCSVNFHEKEIWWSRFGINIGSEQNGIGIHFERPIVILKKLSGTTFLCVPLTTKRKDVVYRFPLSSGNLESYALLDQVRVLDSKRLVRKIGNANTEQWDILIVNFKKLV